MKTKLITLIITVMAIFGFGNASGQNASYKQLWDQVKEADKKDHPKTVVEICDKIIEKARKEGDQGQLLKAWFYRVDKKTHITPDTLYSSLRELETWAKDEKDPATKMVLHSCIATIYSNYPRCGAVGQHEVRQDRAGQRQCLPIRHRCSQEGRQLQVHSFR